MLNNSLSLIHSLSDLFDNYDRVHKALSESFSDYVDLSHPDNIGFEDHGDDGYMMCLELNKKATKDNVTIDVLDGEMTVKYRYSDGTMSTRNEIQMTLPSDMDVNTMNAKVSGGVLTITADKITEEKLVDVDDEDGFEVEINLN